MLGSTHTFELFTKCLACHYKCARAFNALCHAVCNMRINRHSAHGFQIRYSAFWMCTAHLAIKAYTSCMSRRHWKRMLIAKMDLFHHVPLTASQSLVQHTHTQADTTDNQNRFCGCCFVAQALQAWYQDVLMEPSRSATGAPPSRAPATPFGRMQLTTPIKATRAATTAAAAAKVDSAVDHRSFGVSPGAGVISPLAKLGIETPKGKLKVSQEAQEVCTQRGMLSMLLT